MELYEQYLKAYGNEDIKECARLMYKYTNEFLFVDFALPVDYVDTIALFLIEVDRLGDMPTSYQKFHEVCLMMHHRILLGPGRPEVNN